MILDSVSVLGHRLTTFKLRYPKMVHGDFMTHRVFSRNASSSRAIPNERLSVTTSEDLYVPKFRKNRAGMQPGDYLDEESQAKAASVWRGAAEQCMRAARTLALDYNVHKQWTNRMIEWFGHINVIVSATSYKNFIALRTEVDEDMWPMAQDEIYWQATGIRDLLTTSTPTLVHPGGWHLPYIRRSERPMYSDAQLLRISAARCASISYETVEGEPMDLPRAERIYAKLVTARRMHASPMEHQATPYDMATQALQGNFTGWCQHRKMLAGEFIYG